MSQSQIQSHSLSLSLPGSNRHENIMVSNICQNEPG